jgi:tRNA pseudouridine38-40 synthase
MERLVKYIGRGDSSGAGGVSTMEMTLTTPMPFWKIILSYDGTTFHGWQVQPNRRTVQGALAEVIEQITGERVLPQGSGRTDAGVHALGQVASFALEAPLPIANLWRALNRSLPESVRVLGVEKVGPEFHARHSAVGKAYEYRIFERKTGVGAVEEERICSPFAAPFVWACRWKLDLTAMQRAAAMLCGTHDFTSFAASDAELSQRGIDGARPNPVKMIRESTVMRDGDVLRYRVAGSGFLHHMVRNIVGTLVEVGRGSLDADDMERILAVRDRSKAGPTAPAQGLFLVHVEYGVVEQTLQQETETR